MRHHLLRLHAVVYVRGDGLCEPLQRHVCFVIRSALAMRLHVIEREFYTLLNRRTAIATGQPVAEVDCKSLLLADPIHAMPLCMSFVCTSFHARIITSRRTS